ncbi:MAG: sigma-70 family RNA polymerase sigma factor [Archangiaceae bacterium]|nr:sigma-70 family RNA polymerase sigma factor [Archangiaceae bacterium]
MVAVGRGDKAAFSVLFDRHQAGVVRFCGRFVGNTARAEELAQDVFVKLYKSASRYSVDAKFKTFLYRVATNHCLNELRRFDEKRQQEAKEMTSEQNESALEVEASPESPELSLAGKELEAAVASAMQQLSARERAAFTMCRFEGMAYRDIAQALESTESAVKSLIHRATVTVMKHVEAWQQGLLPSRSLA